MKNNRKKPPVHYDEEDYMSAMRAEGYSFHPTTDWWAGSFKFELKDEEPWDGWNYEGWKQERKHWGGGLVACRMDVLRWEMDKQEFVIDPWIWFWGNDDTGMEKQFSTEEEARRFICHLPIIIEMSWLASQGFRFI